jgi:hypothetical protein
MIRRTAAFMAISILLTGCGEMIEKAKIRKTVQRYNELLIRGYHDLNMNPLAEVATPEVAAKSYYHMAAVGEGGLRIESVLKKMDFMKIDLRKSGQAAHVDTREIWDFSQRDMKTGTKYYEELDFVYDMGYELQKTGDNWIITSVTAVRSSSTSNPVNRLEVRPQGQQKKEAGIK